MARTTAPPSRLQAFWAILLITIICTAAASAAGPSAPWQPGLTSTVDELAQLPALVSRPEEEAPPTTTTRGDEVDPAVLLWSAGWQDLTARDHEPEANATGWHPLRIEAAELVPVATLQPGRMAVVRHPAVGGGAPALAKLATDAREAAAYRLLRDLGVTPRFLGHVADGSRIVGLLTEYVVGQEEEEEGGPGRRRAGGGGRHPRREACLAALRRMHARGLAHGDAHGGNCLLRADGSAALIDFELSVETTSREEFDRDLWIMSHTVDD